VAASDANIANALTVARLMATPLFIACAVRAPAQPLFGWLAGLLFAFAAWSDVVDGRIARRRGTASERGRVLDHFADITFILGSLATYVHLGVAPWWVPASIALSFSVYVIDSWRRALPRSVASEGAAGVPRPTLVGSRVGHLGGIANYVLIGVLTFDESAGLHWLPPALVAILFALVPLYSGAAITTRFAAR
jgi:phosphatidylglycerophosphate synthase